MQSFGWTTNVYAESSCGGGGYYFFLPYDTEGDISIPLPTGFSDFTIEYGQSCYSYPGSSVMCQRRFRRQLQPQVHLLAGGPASADSRGQHRGLPLQRRLDDQQSAGLLYGVSKTSRTPYFSLSLYALR